MADGAEDIEAMDGIYHLVDGEVASFIGDEVIPNAQ